MLVFLFLFNSVKECCIFPLQGHGLPISREERFFRFVILHHASDAPPEGSIVIHMQEMAKLMNNDVINNVHGRHCQTVVEGKMLSRTAAAPLRSGLLDGEGFGRDFQLLLVDFNALPDHLLAAREVEFL